VSHNYSHGFSFSWICLNCVRKQERPVISTEIESRLKCALYCCVVAQKPKQTQKNRESERESSDVKLEKREHKAIHPWWFLWLIRGAIEFWWLLDFSFVVVIILTWSDSSKRSFFFALETLGSSIPNSNFNSRIFSLCLICRLPLLNVPFFFFFLSFTKGEFSFVPFSWQP